VTSGISLDEALAECDRKDSTFTPGVRRILAPVRDRFFDRAPPPASDPPKDGLCTVPAYLSDPELREVAKKLAEFGLERGIDVNIACEPDGGTFLHACVRLRDPAIAAETVAWLLAHGADPNRERDDGHTPRSLARTVGRTELADMMREAGGHSD
jgi:ankyrin repeat protein